MGYSRVAVIGASGFIGRYVVKRLAARGAIISAIVRDIEGASVLQPMGDVGQIARIRANLRDETRLAAALAGVDAIVNLVGILHERGKQTFEAVHRRRPGAARAHRQGGRDQASRPCLGDRRLDRLTLRLCPQQGGRRDRRCAPPSPAPSSCGPRSCSGRRTISSTASPPCAQLVRRPAADRRRQNALPAGLCRRRRRGGRAHARRPGAPAGPTSSADRSVYTFKALMELVLAETRRRACWSRCPGALPACRPLLECRRR